MSKKDTQEEPPEGVLVTTAKTIGKAAGKIASAVTASTSSRTKAGKADQKGHKTREEENGIAKKGEERGEKSRTA